MHGKPHLLMPVALAFSAAVLVWLGQATDIDVDIAMLSYDLASGQFPLRDAWFANQFFHGYMKLCVVAIAVAFIACALLDYWRPGQYWSRQTGWRIRTVALCAILIPATISMLKQMSRLHCPWDMALFGGAEPYVRLLDRIPVGVAPGKCFPAGHASGGLWLTSIMMFWLPGKPRLAWGVGGSLLCVGIAMGVVQQVRGAHFMTHTLWSTWIAISIMCAAYCTLRKLEKRHLLNTGQI